MRLQFKILSVAAFAWPLAAAAQPVPEPTPPAHTAPGDVPLPIPAAPPAGSPIGVPPPPPPPVAVEQQPAPPAAAATGSSFMDTRLSFTCTHEDVLREDTVLPSAPGFHCGRPNSLGVLFFDNYDTRFSGFETLSHLALYKHFDKEHWDVEGGFVVRMNEFSEDNIKLSDGGSYIRVGWYFDKTRASKKSLALVAFPVSSDRMRLGYSWRISWGGSPEYFKANPDSPGSVGKNGDSVPGAKLQYDTGDFYAYVGLKSSLLLDPQINEKRSVLAGLAGAGFDVTPMIRVEANGGVFDRGKNESEDVLGEPVTLYGASVQVSLHDGIAVGSSIDYQLYRNQPENLARLYKKEEYPGGMAWLLSFEGTVLRQTLKDADKTGSTTTQQGYAGDMNARVKWNNTRFKLDLMTRDLAYILHSIPSLPTYNDFPNVYTVTPEYFASAGADQYFPESGLTAGLTVGLDIPATLESPTPLDIDGNLTTSTTMVLRTESNRSVLPQGESVAPIIALKASAKVDFAESFAALGEMYFQYDPNTVRYDRMNPEGNFNRAEFANFNQLGFNITLQARF